MSCARGCCESPREHYRSISFSAAAMPTRAPSVVDVTNHEKRLDKDLPAYKRLRADGLQPKHIHGASRVEQAASDAVQVNDGKMYSSRDLKVAKEAATIKKELA